MLRCRPLFILLLSAPLLLAGCAHQPPTDQRPLAPHTQPQFVEPLPNPLANVLAPDTQRHPGADYYHVQMRELHHDFGLRDPATGARLQTRVWGYGAAAGRASFPGPTIEARRDRPIKAYWENRLPETHLLPIDTSVHCGPRKTAAHSHCRPFVRTVVHLHGGHVPDHSDGYPEAWVTPGHREVGPHWSRDVYDYPNDQEAATLWYHDHAMGITRLNVYAGLAGFYLIRDDNEVRLRAQHALPDRSFEIPLLIQDRSFKRDGALAYADRGHETEGRPEATEQKDAGAPVVRDALTGEPLPSIEPEFFGDTIVVNGKIWPYLEVEPRKYRFRFLNGSNARFYSMRLSSGQRFHQIGGDGGLLSAPVTLERLLLGPAERADVILDFADPTLRGQTVILHNDAKTPFPDGDDVDPRTTGRIMAFRVTAPLSATRDVRLPPRLRPPLPALTASTPRDRELILAEGEDRFGRTLPLLGTSEKGPLTWDDPISEIPRVNSTEIWRVINTTPDAHPVHLHLVQFQILDRQRFDTKTYVPGRPETLKPTGRRRLAELNERGPKDTAIMYPGEITRVIAHFDMPGLYVWHCHILEHEDHEMMRPYRIAP